MYRWRLTLALSALLALVCIQAAFVVWGADRVDGYARHSRLTNDLLSELLDLSADKQRLRTWAAQQLMGAGAQPETRDRLLERMHASAARLTDLSRRHLASWESMAARDGVPVPAEVKTLVDISALLDANILEVQAQLQALQALDDHAAFSGVWQQINQVFDTTHGRNLRDLLNGAIEGQRRALPIARAATEGGLERLRQQALLMVVITFAVALGLFFHLSHRLKRPLERLLTAVQALQAGRLDHRIAIGDADHRRDEFDHVAAHFNAMAQELQQHRAEADAVRRRLEEAVQERTLELQTAHETLQRLDHRRRQLFADLSHELRTPATVIRGEADIALRASALSAEDYRATLGRIVAAVKQLSGVTEDLLLVARAEADELLIHPELVALEALVKDTVEQATTMAAVRQLRLTAQLPPPDLVICADSPRLRQALIIVLDNAIRYSRPQGEVSLDCTLFQADRSDPDRPMRPLAPSSLSSDDGAEPMRPDAIEITIRDQGIGIDADELDQVFERFVRGRRARMHRADGTGIGLSIAQSIVQAHGGQILIDSQPDVGTRVRLRLPLRTDADLESGFGDLPAPTASTNEAEAEGSMGRTNPTMRAP